jgi:ubiquinol-cytochrome c reductase cytochrome c1 subunit
MNFCKLIKTIAAAAAALVLASGWLATTSFANEGGAVDHAPINLNDKASLQRGARAFSNYCLNCHAASYMRYSRLTDIGLTEEEIKANLMFATEKVGETMTVALDKADAKVWFGASPPDLSVEARVRGPDWLYTYLRGFYKDSTRPTGWNNLAFPNVGMPHVLYELQGVQTLEESKTEAKEGGEAEVHRKLVLSKPGQLSPVEYDQFTADLVNYLVYMGEPARATRIQIGVMAIFFITLLFFVTLALKKEYWKDIH